MTTTSTPSSVKTESPSVVWRTPSTPRIAPPEADTPLIIDSDTVLPRTITAQTLKPVARRNPKILQTTRGVNLPQLAQRDASDARIEGRNRLPRKQPLSLTIPE